MYIYIYTYVFKYQYTCLCASYVLETRNTKHILSLEPNKSQMFWHSTRIVILFDVYSCWAESVVSLVLGNFIEARMFLQHTTVLATILRFRCDWCVARPVFWDAFGICFDANIVCFICRFVSDQYYVF